MDFFTLESLYCLMAIRETTVHPAWCQWYAWSIIFFICFTINGFFLSLLLCILYVFKICIFLYTDLWHTLESLCCHLATETYWRCNLSGASGVICILIHLVLICQVFNIELYFHINIFHYLIFVDLYSIVFAFDVVFHITFLYAEIIKYMSSSSVLNMYIVYRMSIIVGLLLFRIIIQLPTSSLSVFSTWHCVRIWFIFSGALSQQWSPISLLSCIHPLAMP